MVIQQYQKIVLINRCKKLFPIFSQQNLHFMNSAFYACTCSIALNIHVYITITFFSFQDESMKRQVSRNQAEGKKTDVCFLYCYIQKDELNILNGTDHSTVSHIMMNLEEKGLTCTTARLPIETPGMCYSLSYQFTREAQPSSPTQIFRKKTFSIC